jgi:OOP family OmpA-OmpF porin
MKFTRKIELIALAVLAALASQFAVADDTGWYIGGNAGQSRANIDNARITAQLLGTGLNTTSITDNNRDTGFKLFGGYQINKTFSIEGGYFNLGRFGYVATTIPAGTQSGNIKLQGLNLDGIATLPVTDQFSVLGRLGLNYTQARDSFSSAGAVLAPVNANPSKTQMNYKLGAGLQYSFTDALALRLEAERYRVNDAVGNKGDVDLVSVGLVYHFDVKKPTPAPRAETPEPVVAVVAFVVPPAPAVVPPPPPPVYRKAIFAADSSAGSLFDFGKAEVKPAGKEAIDKFTTDLKGANYQVIRVTGHTDRIGPHLYNQKLSQKRAEAIKAYIAESAGISEDKIEAKGVDGAGHLTKPGECKGKKVTAALKACLAPDRRVEVEVNATRTAM